MYDFSASESSNTKTSLCVAILCVAVFAGLWDFFRIHTIWTNPVTLNAYTRTSALSSFFSKFSGKSSKHAKKIKWEIRPLSGKPVSSKVLTVPILAMGLIASSEIGRTRKISAIDAGADGALIGSFLPTTSLCFAAAASNGHFFDAFSGSIQDPATIQIIFTTFLVFSAAWDFLVCLTTLPKLGPILRGIIQVKTAFVQLFFDCLLPFEMLLLICDLICYHSFCVIPTYCHLSGLWFAALLNF
jgi:hypothetical protein